MKRIGVTQRLGTTKHGELRAQLDVNLINFINKCGYYPIIIPYYHENNHKKSLQKLLKWIKLIKLSGIVLSGGDDIGKYILRDRAEQLLIKYSIKNKIPLFGICRGMQIIGKYFKSSLIKVNKHVNNNHLILKKNKSVKVNSYHNYSLKRCPKNFEIEFMSADGKIESMISKDKKIYACMWHPERYKKFKDLDINNFKKIFS